MSAIATQYAPDAVSVPVSCAVVVLACAVVVPPVRNVQPPAPFGLPTPRPIVIVGGGPAAVMVTLTVPGVVTVKLWTFCPPTATVPVKTSFETVAFEPTVVGAVVEPPHAA